MKKCPSCKSRIQDHHMICPKCGEIVATPPEEFTPGDNEYRSKIQFFGIPLVHIVRGPDPGTGRLRWAKGVIAIGHLAIGGLAIGNIAYGGIALGSISFGLFSVGALAIGIFAVGGMGLGVLFAAGGLAASIQVAVGGLALAPHALGGNRVDQEVFSLIDQFFLWFTR
jgi:ribosomal protein L32